MEFLVKTNNSVTLNCSYNLSCPNLGCVANCPALSSGCMVKVN